MHVRGTKKQMGSPKVDSDYISGLSLTLCSFQGNTIPITFYFQ